MNPIETPTHVQEDIVEMNSNYREITNREWDQIAAIAERHTHAIQKTNDELAGALFAVFVHAHSKLSDRMSDLEAAEHRYQTREWYRRDKHVKYKMDVEFAKMAVTTQKDVVDNCIIALSAIATELEG